MKTTRDLLASLDSFTRGYLLAALWTWDPHPGSGDYRETGLAQMRRISPESIETARYDCARFERDNATALEVYGSHRDSESAGHDLWLTRNGHGTGFADRAWDYRHEDNAVAFEAACNALDTAACEFGSVDVMADGATEAREDDGESPIRLSNEGEHVLKSAGLHWTQTGDRRFDR